MQQHAASSSGAGYSRMEESTALQDVQRFLETEELDKAIVFAKNEDAFVTYMTSGAWLAALLSGGMLCFCPLSLFRPRKVIQHYSLQLDQDNLTFNSAWNDCCTHISRGQKTVPLDKIQDVQLQEGCCQTLFGLKTIEVQTAGMNGPNGAPEITATFLAHPEEARQAIQLAMKLTRARLAVAPGHMAAMQRSPGAGAPAGVMHARLQRLVQLKDLGVITQEQADQVRAKVLTADKDWTLSLWEAHDLQVRGLLPEADATLIREELLQQMLTAGKGATAASPPGKKK